jgi:hypothetical protein
LASRHVEYANVKIESRAFLVFAEVLSNVVVAKVVRPKRRVRSRSMQEIIMYPVQNGQTGPARNCT